MAAINREICGADIKALRERLGMGTREFSYVMGMGTLQFHELTNQKNLRKQVNDPALALLVRWYNEFPEDVPRLPTPTFQDVFDAIEKLGMEMKPHQVVTILGRNFTSLYRYRSAKKEGNPKHVNGIASTAFRVLEAIAKKRGAKGVEKWRENANLEARVRGAEFDIAPRSGFSTHTWPSPNAKKEQKSTKGKNRASG